MTLLALGLNHTTAPVEIRERVAISGDALPGALTDLRHRPGVEEVAILSTCNRTEIYCSLAEVDHAPLLAWLSGFHHIKESDLSPFFYSYPDATAVKHVLRVASGLDSMVLGEPQVLGQLKTAYRTAREAGSIGQLLGRLFQHSFRVAKEIRSNTEIGSHPVSVAYAAVRLGQQIFGQLTDRTALLIGAGETIELTARHLYECGLHRIIIANRTLANSSALAAEFSGYAITLEDIPSHLDEADIVISATAATEPVITRAQVETAVKKRRHRPMYIVDIAVPRDVEPAVAQLPDVYLYTVDDLQDVIAENLRNREQAAKQAEEIIDTQVVQFMDWLQARDAVPTIRAIRDHAEQQRAEVLDQALRRLRLGENAETVMTEMARALSNKLIHSPSARLRNVEESEREQMIRTARLLFDVNPEDGSSGERDPS